MLDEIEKAHNDVFNILLQVLDDGRLTDGQGRTVDFKNTVIIMTSNLGSELIRDLKDENYEDVKTAVMEVVSKYFRPEFINRIDETVVFHTLKKEQIHSIANIQIENLRKRLKAHDLKLELSENALNFLSEKGYDPVYGARPLKRVIQQNLENPLAEKILSGKYQKNAIIHIDFSDDRLTFN